tara:strand:- start:287 stop:1825 length:1539 start_codon:yes stop_codon:yes gene_type:complete
MTTKYKGSTMGLNYNASTATWNFTNEANDFIDTDSFSSKDPDFKFAPTEDKDDDTEEDTKCPAGYIYDNTLKQCVPEPQQFRIHGGEKDDESIGMGNRRDMPQIPEYLAGVTGAKAYVPQQDISGFDESGNPILVTEPGSAFDQSGINYGKIFPYATTAKTRAQMNEHMLISYGIDKGWIAFDDEKNAYRKIQFQEQLKDTSNMPIIAQWGINLLQANNYRSYKDYFKILDEGWQPKNDNIWNKFLRGNSVYSLKGGMIYKDTSTRGGRTSDVTYVGYSKDFMDKVKHAMSIPNGIIDRDGNVNVRGDSEGGYYNSEGKYINADGSSGGGLVKGIQYLFNLEKSGLKLPDNLKKRLIKGINTKALSYEQRQNYAELLGYNSWQEVVKKANNAIQNSDTWTMGGVVEDVQQGITTTKDDNVNEDGIIDTTFKIGADTVAEQSKKEEFLKRRDKEGRSREQAEKSYVKQQAKNIVSKPKYQKQFKKDDMKTPSGKSYTQSKIEQAAKTGRYTGF